MLQKQSQPTCVTQSDAPRALAFVIAQAAIGSPTGGLNVIEINNVAGTWQFPNAAPSVVAVAIVVGGRPGTIYGTKFQLLEGDELIGEARGPEIPFTTQIKRVNITMNLAEMNGGAAIIQHEGMYTVRLLVNDQPIADTDFEIRRVPPPGAALPQ
jgi:hypothetical protein